MKYGLFIAGLIAASTFSTAHASNAEQVKSNFVISSYAKTKYPIWFLHMVVAGFIKYWWRSVRCRLLVPNFTQFST